MYYFTLNVTSASGSKSREENKVSISVVATIICITMPPHLLQCLYVPAPYLQQIWFQWFTTEKDERFPRFTSLSFLLCKLITFHLNKLEMTVFSLLSEVLITEADLMYLLCPLEFCFRSHWYLDLTQTCFDVCDFFTWTLWTRTVASH